MADATPESNLALIEELQSLVSADYTVPEGPEISYPAVGQAVDDEMWKYITLALGNGVLDEGGRPYNLVRLGSDSETNSKNQMKLTVSTITEKAQAVLKGFYHRLVRDMVLDFPMPLSETTYYVVLELNPLKARTPEGPISVKVYPNELNTESGREHLVLWTVKRKPNQLLTDAEVWVSRPRVVPTHLLYERDQLPDPSKCVWGAMYFVSKTAEILMAVGANQEAQGPTTWQNLTSPAWVETQDGSSYVYTGSGYRVAIKRQGNTRELRGQWKRTTGQPFYPDSSYLLYSLSEDDRPKKVMRFKTAGPGTANGGTIITVTVAPNGEVQASPNKEAAWLSLDGVRFDVE